MTRDQAARGRGDFDRADGTGTDARRGRAGRAYSFAAIAKRPTMTTAETVYSTLIGRSRKAAQIGAARRKAVRLFMMRVIATRTRLSPESCSAR